MKQNKSIITLFIMTSLSILLLIFSLFSLIKKEEKRINININKEKEIIKLIDFTINPSEEITYKIYLDAKNKISYDMKIWFTHVEESLKDILFIYVRYNTYRTNKFSVYDVNSDNKLMFNYIKLFKYKYFELVFYIPENIGNEAQNLDFNFKTFINAKG